ncbi:MAG: hypothetical protein HZA53_00370 [Planctomycetes bacterium]|nr:hypothetical protein [Planctomycetota bacterium]
MRVARRWIVFGALAAVAAFGAFAPSGGCAAGPALVGEAGADWIAQKADGICGLDDPARVSNPALVQYASLVDATPEAKKLRDEDIDPRSAAGIQLLQRAADRVRDECETVRAARGHCSVWKRIRHRDGRVVADVTEFVLARIRPPR